MGRASEDFKSGKERKQEGKKNGRGKREQQEMQTGFKRERGRPRRREKTSMR